MENGNKKKQQVDLILGGPILISLGGQASRLENLLWLGCVSRDRVHTCPSRHRHQEERSVMQCFFVAPRAACRSCSPGIVASVCVRAQYARGCGRPWCVSSFCLRVAGRVLGRGNHASVGSDILLWQHPGKVDACATAVEGKNTPITGSTRWASPSARSAQIKGAVRVHQESLIR